MRRRDIRRLRRELHLKEGDYIHAAYAESSAGPGWANSPIWVVIQGRDGAMRLEAIQPEFQTDKMQALYSVSQSAHIAMTNAVTRAIDLKAPRV